MSKPRNRLPVVTDLSQMAKAWDETDAKAIARRAADREAWERRVAAQERAIALKRDEERRALILKAEASRQWSILAETLKRTMERIAPLPRHPTRWIGSSLSGPAPGPHYPYNVPGEATIEAHLHDGGRGTGGGDWHHPHAARGDYLLTDD